MGKCSARDGQYWPDRREGTIQKLRAEYFPVLPDHSECNNLFIIMTFHNEISTECKLIRVTVNKIAGIFFSALVLP